MDTNSGHGRNRVPDFRKSVLREIEARPASLFRTKAEDGHAIIIEQGSHSLSTNERHQSPPLRLHVVSGRIYMQGRGDGREPI
jgi:hypothetical protein